MNVAVTITGSYPPLRDERGAILVDESIKRAIRDQIEAELDVLTDGQVRSDIVGIFAREIGLEGKTLPYSVPNKLGKPNRSTTLEDLELAYQVAEGCPLKAHLTGPTVIAESCLDEDDGEASQKGTHPNYQGEEGTYNLVLDIAKALAEEARLIAAQAENLNVQYLQIDEPSLVYGADLSLARQGVERVASAWKEAGGGPVLLHVCGDSASIWETLLEMPVDILNLENETLRTLNDEQIQKLTTSGKRLALGMIPVNVERIPSPQRIARRVLFAAERFGEEALWGLTPDCGLRLSPPEKARQRMNRLHQAAEILGQQSGGREI